MTLQKSLNTNFFYFTILLAENKSKDILKISLKARTPVSLYVIVWFNLTYTDNSFPEYKLFQIGWLDTKHIQTWEKMGTCVLKVKKISFVHKKYLLCFHLNIFSCRATLYTPLCVCVSPVLVRERFRRHWAWHIPRNIIGTTPRDIVLVQVKCMPCPNLI